jgi:hypothetical protein
MTWVQDIAMSYVGGIALGAPAGLLAVWATNRDAMLTAVIVCAMVGLLTKRRMHRRVAAPKSRA